MEPTSSSSWSIPAGAELAWLRLIGAITPTPPPCSDDPGDWFATRATGPEAQAQDRAQAACLRCGALEPCRAYALAADERDGVWGGLLPVDRRALRRGAGGPAVVTHEVTVTVAAVAGEHVNDLPDGRPSAPSRKIQPSRATSAESSQLSSPRLAENLPGDDR